MSNEPEYIAKPKGNPNIREISKLSTGPKTELGKFRSSINAYKGHDSNEWRNKQIPKKVRELFSWYKGLSVHERDFLFEMKGIYEALKGNLQNNKEFADKLLSGEPLKSSEREHIKLLIDSLDKLQKHTHGEKKVNINVDVRNLRDSLFEDDNR